MPLQNFPRGDSPLSSHVWSNNSNVQVYIDYTMPARRAMANGLTHSYIIDIRVYAAAQSGTTNLSAKIGSTFGSNVSASVQTGSGVTKKTLPLGAFATSGASYQLGFRASNGTNFRTSGSGTGETKNSATSTTWTGLSGQYNYAEAPNAPTGLAASGITPTSADLSWAVSSDNGGLAILDYRLEVSRNAAFTDLQGTYNTGTSVTTSVGGLSPVTQYWARVAASNLVTQNYSTTGPWSSVITFTTTSAVPGPPRNVAVTALSALLKRVTWIAPASNGGSAITGYTLQYANNVNFTGATTVNLGNVLTWDSPSLSVGTWWFRVRAVNANGPGAYSDPVSDVVTATGFPKVSIGGSFVSKPLKVRVGSSWVTKPLKVWTGSNWKTLI